jgi:hypothetical protein
MVGLYRAFLGCALASALVWTVDPGKAEACGGLFCNASQPVNQAAERIIFAQNGDGTVTAVIEIQYQGPAASFSWVLPVPGVPMVDVSSTAALDRLQQATNPQFVLQTSFEPGCDVPRAQAGSATGNAAPDDAESGPSDVVVLAAGTVGPFDYQVIQVRAGLADAADVAVEWLETNQYDVTAIGPDVLRPYLEGGLNLIAFRLNKQSDTGSIRPIRITYESELPFIPIRPTAVAANDDMGVLVWVLGPSRAIPDNYKHLVLNEARIDWFNPMSTYNDVVSEAADEADGHGFVTELAADSDTLQNIVLQDWEAQEWQRVSSQQYATPIDFLMDASSTFSQWDGFEDALRDALTLPANVAIEDFLNCTRCFADMPDFVLDEAAFRLALFEKVYDPMLETQELLTSLPYVSRLYTTLSASEMTMDPAFNFNPDLPDVSNVHTATQILGCQDDSWRIELEDGTEIHGTQARIWPVEDVAEQPAALKIMMLSTRGQGEVLTDNTSAIARLLEEAGHAGPSPDGGPRLASRGGDDGCTVAARSGAQTPAFLLLAVAWLALSRSRFVRRDR